MKKLGGQLRDSYLEDGFILDKEIGIGQPKRMTNCKVLVANTPMDHDKIKIYGSILSFLVLLSVAAFFPCFHLLASIAPLLLSRCSCPCRFNGGCRRD